MSEAAFIRAQNLVKVFSDADELIGVLRGLNLVIAEKEILTVIGQSGAGKSTLLHLLGGLDRPTFGRIFYGDADITAMEDRELVAFRNRDVGFVFQFHHLLPEFTALENVAMGGLIGGVEPKEARDRARETLVAVGLRDRLTHKPPKLSGGERQRVALARALVNEPRVVLADEPTGNLDRKTSEAVHNLIWELRERLGQTFVIVTHNERLAERSDRTVELVDGRAENIASKDEEHGEAFAGIESVGVEKDCYEALDVPIKASGKEIKRAYRRLLKQRRPDRNRDDRVAAEKLKRIQEAYRILSDQERRAWYDQQVRRGADN